MNKCIDLGLILSKLVMQSCIFQDSMCTCSRPESSIFSSPRDERLPFRPGPRSPPHSRSCSAFLNRQTRLFLIAEPNLKSLDAAHNLHLAQRCIPSVTSGGIFNGGKHCFGDLHSPRNIHLQCNIHFCGRNLPQSHAWMQPCTYSKIVKKLRTLKLWC